MRISVRKAPMERGLSRVAFGNSLRSRHHVCVDKKAVLTVDYSYNHNGWYWYGDGINTLDRSSTFPSFEAAAEDAKAYLRQKDKA